MTPKDTEMLNLIANTPEKQASVFYLGWKTRVSTATVHWRCKRLIEQGYLEKTLITNHPANGGNQTLAIYYIPRHISGSWGFASTRAAVCPTCNRPL